MRILLIAKPWRGGLARYIAAALEDLVPGHVQWLPTYPATISDKLRYRVNRDVWHSTLVQTIQASNYDLALFINVFPGCAGLEADKRHILWQTDNPLKVAHLFNRFGKVYISDPGYLDEVRQQAPGTDTDYLPFACLPSIHKPYQQDAAGSGVCFIGNRDQARDQILQPLLAERRDLTVYGNYFLQDKLFWQHMRAFRPAIKNEAMGRIYAKYQASLNIYARVVRAGTNMRTFECAAYGIAQIIEYKAGIENLFEPDSEVLLFSNIEECKDQITRLAKDRKMAVSLSERARKRVLAEHGYQHRLKKILEDFRC